MATFPPQTATPNRGFKPKQTCKYWPLGTCKNGNACPFLHDNTAPPRVDAAPVHPPYNHAAPAGYEPQGQLPPVEHYPVQNQNYNDYGYGNYNNDWRGPQNYPPGPDYGHYNQYNHYEEPMRRPDGGHRGGDFGWNDNSQGQYQRMPTDYESVSVFVGQVPKDMTEEQIWNYFSEYGALNSVQSIRDRNTGDSRGAAFVSFKRIIDAEIAMVMLHDKVIIEPSHYPLQISWSNAEAERMSFRPPPTEKKLFIGQIPRGYPEQKLREIFHEGGDILEMVLPEKLANSARCCGLLDIKICVQLNGPSTT